MEYTPITDSFEILGAVGSGTFGTVFRACQGTKTGQRQFWLRSRTRCIKEIIPSS